MGVTAFIVASDQILLRDAAKAQLQDFQNSFSKQRDRADGL